MISRIVTTLSHGQSYRLTSELPQHPAKPSPSPMTIPSHPLTAHQFNSAVSAAASFHAGSPSHLTFLALLAIFLFFTIRAHRRDPDSMLSRATRSLIIFANLTAAVSALLAYRWSGTPATLDNLIPLHLCDLMAIVAAFALILRKQILSELTYYLGLGATLQGLLTPNLSLDFPHPVFFSFFQLHGAVVAAALLLPLGFRWRPRVPLWKTILRVLLITDAYLIAVYIINLALGTNFAFVMKKPELPSLMDHLGPHPWYLVSLQILAALVMLLLSLPFLKLQKPPSPCCLINRGH